jgi:hypothetical protein
MQAEGGGGGGVAQAVKDAISGVARAEREAEEARAAAAKHELLANAILNHQVLDMYTSILYIYIIYSSMYHDVCILSHTLKVYTIPVSWSYSTV